MDISSLREDVESFIEERYEYAIKVLYTNIIYYNCLFS
jgi:hypothetical protein